MDVKNIEHVDAEIAQALVDLMFEISGSHAMAAGHNVSRSDDTGGDEGFQKVLTRICRITAIEWNISGLSGDHEFVAAAFAAGLKIAKGVSDSPLAALEAIVDRSIDDVRSKLDGAYDCPAIVLVGFRIRLAEVCADADRRHQQALLLPKMSFGNRTFEPLGVS